MAIRLPRSRREAISIRRVISANTAQPPWKRIPAATTNTPGIGPMAARCQSSARVTRRRRMDGELAVVCNGLDDEDPCVSTPKPPTDRAGEANVIARINVVLRQQLRPTGITSHAFAPDHGCVEIRFE